MIDSRLAAHVAFYTTLAATTDVTDKADVYGHAPEGTEPKPSKGLVLLGLASAESAGGKSDEFDEVIVEILSYVRQPDVTILYALSTAIRNALEGQELTVDGAEISPPEFLSVEPDFMDDGQTYFDVLRFRTFVQPA